MGHQYRLDIPALDNLVTSVPMRKGNLFEGVKESNLEWPEQAEPENDPGFLSRVIDYASRPFMTPASFMQELANPKSNVNPFEAAYNTWTGENPVTWADTLQTADDFIWTESDMPDWVRGTVGLGLDVALDPLNLIPGAVIAKGWEKAAHTVIPHEGLAAVVSHPLKATHYWARGQHKEDAARAAGLLTPKHTVEDIEEAGGITDRVHHGDLEDTPDLVNPAPNRMPDLTGEADEVFAPPYSPSSSQKNPFDPAPSSPANPFVESLVQGKGAKDPAGVDPVTGNPFVRTPDGQRMTFVTTPAGEATRVSRDVYAHPTARPELEATGMRELPPGRPKAEVATAKLEEAAAGTTGASTRIFEGAAQRRWDMNANAFNHADELATATKLARSRQNEAAFLHANGINMEGKNSVHWGEQDKAVYNSILNDMRRGKHEAMVAGDAPVTLIGKDRVMLHMADVIDSIPAKDFIKMHMIRMKPPKGIRFNLPPSSIQHGAGAAVLARNAGLTGDNMIGAIVHAIHDANKTATRISSKHAKQAAEVFAANVGKLQHHVVKNEQIVSGSAAHRAGLEMGETVAKDIKQVLDDPLTSQSKELVRVADLYGQINREVRNQGLPVGSSMAAGQRAREGLDGVIDDLDVAAARDMLAVAKRVQKGENTAAKEKLLETYLRDSAAAAKQSARNADDFAVMSNIYSKPGERMAAPPDMLADLADREIDDFLNGFNRMYRKVTRNLIGGMDQGKFFGIRRSAQATAGFMHAQFKRDMMKLQKDYGEKAFDEAFDAIWYGANLTKVPKDLQPIVTQMYGAIKHFIDPAGGFVDNAIFRSGLEIPAANAMFKARGLPWLEIKQAYRGEPLAQAWLRQVKELKIKGSKLDFLTRFHGVAVDASVLSAMARHAEAYGSATAKAGFSRLAQSAKFDDAPVSHFINPERYLPDEIIEQLRRANVESLKPTNWGKSDTAIGKFMNQVFMPLTRAWKTFATTLRVGHHMANIMGDLAVNYIKGVRVRDYAMANDALRSVGLVGRQTYEMLDRALHEGLGAYNYAYKGSKGMKHAFDITLKNGQKISYTHGQLGEELLRNGALSDFRMLEDLDELARNKIDQFSDRVLNTRYGRAFEKVSEWNSNTQRSAQAINMMRNPKFTKNYDTTEDAWKAAIGEALKGHPDSAGLSAWERKWGRALIPFYSYNRQILPWVITNFAANPGRMMRIPKLQYNMQVAAGGDPEQPGMPFTGPEVLPPWALTMLGGNFMGDNQDPTGLNFGYSLSSPLDTLADWTNQAGQGGNPLPQMLKQTVSSVNPLLTLPFHIYDPTKDKSETVDQRIPGAATLGSVTGISTSGSLGNLLSGTPALDYTRQVEQGNRSMIFNEALINFLTGLRITDYSDYAGGNQSGVRTTR